MTMAQVLGMYALFNYFLGSGAVGLGYVFVSLFMTCLWIIFDTQVIVEQSERGIRHVAGHALMLFQDLLKLFIKIVRILMEM